ncbi:hypothetical protein N7509_007440 [Penicillium cosmopolitanum]|uniref:Uncharacterized protein n=1 Tax=Penicillium cosmopolitanum TaxID=1131564 RepID=A0A9W9VZD4_9EURO|nr:uncharacterized protein N7509_007440 [Penicillium cosmopolitanum]KAJ5391950.1 hypothetical protein N7509_007440 [Penicillium cosmopolitanum]
MSDKKSSSNPFEDLDRHHAEQEMENRGLPPYSRVAPNSASEDPAVNDSKDSKKPQPEIYDAPEVVPQVDRETLPEVVPVEENLPEVRVAENTHYYNQNQAFAPPANGSGYPPADGKGYPPVNGPGYAPSDGKGYSPVGGSGYPPANGPGYPPAFGPGYAPADGQGYPPANGPGYPPAFGPGYPPADGQGYPQAGGPGYPPAYGPGYPPTNAPGYSPTPMPNPQDRTIAIPAVDSSPGSPLLRAYVPMLNKYNLPQESFFRFLDSLNDVITTNPPMQVLDVTGGILKSVPILFPLHWIGSAFSGLANISEQSKSKSRSDSALKQANKEIFGPRGLKAELANLDALAYIAKIPILDPQGKINKNSTVVRQLADMSRAYRERRNGSDSKEQDQKQAHELDLQQQRLHVLQPWIQDLQLDIKPTAKSRLTRFNSALKKYNDPRRQDSNYRSENGDEQDRFRKCLWLVIREVDGNGGQSQAGPSK